MRRTRLARELVVLTREHVSIQTETEFHGKGG
jgi:hypothetical protein